METSEFYTHYITLEGRGFSIADNFLPIIGWEPPKNGIILDAGCCTGIQAIELAERYYKRNVSVIAVDFQLTDGYELAFPTPRGIYFEDREDATGFDLRSRISFEKADFMVPGFLGDRKVDAALMMNNFSYDLAGFSEILEDRIRVQQILEDRAKIQQRIGAVVDCLNLNGILAIWADHAILPSFILRKTLRGMVVGMDHEQYSRYFNQSYPQWKRVSQKVVNDHIEIAQKVCDSVN